MKFRHVAAFACAGFLSVSLPALAVAQETSTRAPASIDAQSLSYAREILALGMPEETREQVFLATMDQMMAQVRAAMEQTTPIDDPQVVAIVDKHLALFRNDAAVILRDHLPNIMEGWARSYSVMFTRDELRDIRDFVATPSGQKFFELSPAILAESNFAEANQLYMNDVTARIPDMQDKLKADLLKYFEEAIAEAARSES